MTTPDLRAARAAALGRSNSRLAVALVAGILGVLAIGQLRGQAGVPGLSGLSSTELTQLIANLNAGNDRLRDELSDLQRQEQKLKEAHDRGQTTVGDLGTDLSRIRAWSGLTPVTGQGISILITGQIGGDGVEDLLNELRNAGAEGIAVDGVRIVTGSVVAGAPDGLSVENHAIGATFEIRAIGSPQILTGTLTRTGGVIAQVTSTYEAAQITVTPIESMTLPATERDLTLTDATPKL
ncbi:MAG TPA: DUF881 domain-containing protein [Candidatus Limnocylindrales bacterium]|nr:DUF881 domain-containing protein [Candidatus Limnocylindrales bacterium]